MANRVIISARTGQQTIVPLTPEEEAARAAAALPTQEDLRAAVDAHVEATARARGYNGASHCAGYVTSTVPLWAAEAAAFVAWRDQVWSFVFARMAEALAGQIAWPTTPQLLVNALPAMTWPEGAA